MGDMVMSMGVWGGRRHYDMKCPECDHNGILPPCQNCGWNGTDEEVCQAVRDRINIRTLRNYFHPSRRRRIFR